MLFCPPNEVNDVWEIVAKATANNELGIAAKVAPKPVEDDFRRDRLICVYTSDFADRADVGRVLQKLRELRLVEARGRFIYYKPGKNQPVIWGWKIWMCAYWHRRIYLPRDKFWEPLGTQIFHLQLAGDLPLGSSLKFLPSWQETGLAHRCT